MAYIEILHHNPIIQKFNDFTVNGKEHYLVDLYIADISYEKALEQGFDPKLHETVNKYSKIYIFDNFNNIDNRIHYSDL